MGFFSKAGPAGNESGGWVNGKHRSGKNVKGWPNPKGAAKGKHAGKAPGKSGRPDPYADDGDWRGGW